MKLFHFHAALYLTCSLIQSLDAIRFCPPSCNQPATTSLCLALRCLNRGSEALPPGNYTNAPTPQPIPVSTSSASFFAFESNVTNQLISIQEDMYFLSQMSVYFGSSLPYYSVDETNELGDVILCNPYTTAEPSCAYQIFTSYSFSLSVPLNKTFNVFDGNSFRVDYYLLNNGTVANGTDFFSLSGPELTPNISVSAAWNDRGNCSIFVDEWQNYEIVSSSQCMTCSLCDFTDTPYSQYSNWQSFRPVLLSADCTNIKNGGMKVCEPVLPLFDPSSHGSTSNPAMSVAPTSFSSTQPAVSPSFNCLPKQSKCANNSDCCSAGEYGCYGKRSGSRKCLKCATKKMECRKTSECCLGGKKYKCDKKSRECIKCGKKGSKCKSKVDCCSSKCTTIKGVKRCK